LGVQEYPGSDQREFVFQWVTKYTKKDGSLVFKIADRSITTLHKRNNVFDEARKFRVGLLKSGKKN